MTFHSHGHNVNGQTLHVKTGGVAGAPPMLMLHGFPEYWVAWAEVARHFIDRYHVILPDQRGFNRSSKPVEREAYHTKHLVADMIALMDAIAPDQDFVVCGHDWGASIAYALAMRHANRVSHLVIANGVHPMCFQKALYAGDAQTSASQYMNVLRAEGSEELLAADNFKRLAGMFEKFSAAPWLNSKTRRNYIETWSQPGALPAMLNWYRSSPMVVPESNMPGREFPLTDTMYAKYRITMPHLLLWGLQDTALLPEAREDLDAFCEDLRVIESSDASHWILHEKPEWAAEKIEQFLACSVLR